ncbi:hypothetical protein MNBD_CHLOROFLEXI01-2750 [hydrothermal vent metagenome]|uniref:Uncharacterized protein n=1 Tax=hydrothermal vent metagenome TaxID=652676 RepID=A0A3B0W0K9_9ZZZZ
MALYTNNLPAHVSKTWELVRQLNKQERLMLAKALLDSVVTPAMDEESDWHNLSLTAFAADWDNPDDAIYDNWREYYDV